MMPTLDAARHRQNTTCLRFAGYAALFGIPDAGRDTILPGAFAASLKEMRNPLPLYWQHRPTQRIGTVEVAKEDARGLRIVARIDRLESRAAVLLRAGSLTGLSFGYRARDARNVSGGRVLRQVDLFEISLVIDPLQSGARVHLVT